MRSLRILFVLEHPGLLLHFDETVRGLADRGHHVRVAFGHAQKDRAALAALDDTVEIAAEPVARRADDYAAVADRIRAGQDIVHYLNADLEAARYTRPRALRKAGAPEWVRDLAGRHSLSGGPHRALRRTLGALEAALPVDAGVASYIRESAPDVLLVSPYVQREAWQVDYVRAAQALGIATGLCVASWDNLTTKGCIRTIPDRVVVWNETQRREAVDLHGVPAERVVLTGAQQFDRWFDREPSSTREAFCQAMGLPEDRPYVLFIGSSAWRRRPHREEEYLRTWLAALRASDDPLLRDLAVLVRPHPTTSARWEEIDVSTERDVVVWTRDTPLPVPDAERLAYFDSIHHSAAMFGINSSAMIEAAIVGRPVHTVTLPRLRPMQRDLIHFGYMLTEHGGFLREATSFDEHVRMLGEDLRSPDAWRPDQERFVASSIRPHGREAPALPRLLDAIEGLGDVAVAPVSTRPAPGRAALRGALLVTSRRRKRRLRTQARRRKAAARR